MIFYEKGQKYNKNVSKYEIENIKIFLRPELLLRPDRGPDCHQIILLK